MLLIIISNENINKCLTYDFFLCSEEDNSIDSSPNVETASPAVSLRVKSRPVSAPAKKTRPFSASAVPSSWTFKERPQSALPAVSMVLEGDPRDEMRSAEKVVSLSVKLAQARSHPLLSLRTHRVSVEDASISSKQRNNASLRPASAKNTTIHIEKSYSYLEPVSVSESDAEKFEAAKARANFIAMNRLQERQIKESGEKSVGLPNLHFHP